jgi:ATP-dependent protease ClpP protease subunit
MTIFERLAAIAAKAPVEKPETIVNRKGDEATLYLYDAVTPPGWGGISAADFAKALDGIKDAKTLHLRINSPGGAVYEAKAIYQALKEFPGHKVAHVDGLAASAASFIAMAADRIVTAPEATWFVHNAQGVAMGDAASMRDTADLLDMESDNLRAIYQKRTGQAEADLRGWMDAETFMTAAEAKARGFTDEIQGEEDAAPAMAAEMPRIAIVAAETRRFVTDPENVRRLKEHREARLQALRRQQDRTRASASASGQPGRK